jgi:histidine triad (HIT) family protein
MSDCIFCRIASKEVPARLVHEDDLVVAFPDAHPQAPLHVLVVPRAHVPSLGDTSDEALLGRIGTVAAKVARDAGYASSGYRVVTNSGPDAGQSVPHLHFHVLGGRALGLPWR